MNALFQSSAAPPRPRGYDLFLHVWFLIGLAVMKNAGYHTLCLHDEIIFTKATR